MDVFDFQAGEMMIDTLEFHLERLEDASQERVNAFVADWLEVESIVELFEEA